MAKVETFGHRKVEKTGEWTVSEAIEGAAEDARQGPAPSGVVVLLTYEDDEGGTIAHYTSGLEAQELHWCLIQTALRVLTGGL